jgi:hypothetical protein
LPKVKRDNFWGGGRGEDAAWADQLSEVMAQKSDVPNCKMLTDEIDLALHG